MIWWSPAMTSAPSGASISLMSTLASEASSRESLSTRATITMSASQRSLTILQDGGQPWACLRAALGAGPIHVLVVDADERGIIREEPFDGRPLILRRLAFTLRVVADPHVANGAPHQAATSETEIRSTMRLCGA